MASGKKLPMAGGRQDPLERLLAGDSAGVIADLGEKLAADPNDDVAWLQLGTAYAHIKHWADAANAYQKAVELDGDLLASRRGYARALGKLRRFDEAAFQLVRAKRLAPNDKRVAHELGIAFYDKRLFDKALRELGRARELDPADARTHFSIGLAHEGKDDMASAIAAYRRAVELDPDHGEARLTLADALAAMGEIAAAIEELAQAQARDRSNAQIANNLDVLKKGLQQLEAARLIGKSESELEQCALVQLGQLKRKGKTVVAGEPDVVRYGAELAELWVTFDDSDCIATLTLLLPDPERAANAPGDAFQVTVVSKDGEHVPANFATAATVTFLREALGCPLTRASELYALVLNSQEPVRWGGLLIAVTKANGEDRYGLRVAPG